MNSATFPRLLTAGGIAVLAISMAVLMAPASAQAVGGVIALPHLPRPPALLINEVLFDETGNDSMSTVGSESIELYAVSSTLLSNYSLTDNFGTVLGVLPSVTVPANGVVLMILGGGSTPWDPDTDLSDGTAAYMLGLSKTDHLGNSSGCVRLLNATGDIIDQVYWGTGSAPSGAIGNHWVTGTYFDISMNGQPMNEGDSLGRPASQVAHYTGKLADWDSNGGVNAAGPTPKGRNGVEKADANTLIAFTQTGVNLIVTAFSEAADPGWISFTGSSVGTPMIAQSGDTLTVTAIHAFSVTLHGVPTTLSGSIVTDYVRLSGRFSGSAKVIVARAAA